MIHEFFWRNTLSFFKPHEWAWFFSLNLSLLLQSSFFFIASSLLSILSSSLPFPCSFFSLFSHSTQFFCRFRTNLHWLDWSPNSNQSTVVQTLLWGYLGPLGDPPRSVFTPIKPFLKVRRVDYLFLGSTPSLGSFCWILYTLWGGCWGWSRDFSRGIGVYCKR